MLEDIYGSFSGEYNIEDEPDAEITLGGALAYSLEVSAAYVILPESSAVWNLINELRDSGDNIVEVRKLLERITY